MRNAPGSRLHALLLLATSTIGCASATLPASISSERLGDVQIRSSSLTVSDLSPTRCHSGERQLFLGADFLDAQGVTARVIVEPGGRALLRFFTSAKPLDPGTSFARADCSVFELSLERTGWQIDDVYDLALSLQFDCRNSAGENATGRLAAPHCH